MIRYTDYISPEEYMELRKKVGWTEFPLEQAEACISKAYMIQCVRDDEKAIGVVRLLWDGGYIAFLSDVIVDIVETGSTLKANRLKVLEEVLPISARMIVNPVSMQMKTERIREMIDRVRDCLQTGE